MGGSLWVCSRRTSWWRYCQACPLKQWMILNHLSSSWFSLENTAILQCQSRPTTKHLSILSEKRLLPSADSEGDCFGLSRYLHFWTKALSQSFGCPWFYRERLPSMWWCSWGLFTVDSNQAFLLSRHVHLPSRQYCCQYNLSKLLFFRTKTFLEKTWRLEPK